jgi:hypothetical protein
MARARPNMQSRGKKVVRAFKKAHQKMKMRSQQKKKKKTTQKKE